MSGSSVLLLVGAILVSTESSRALNFGDRCQTPKEEPGKCVTIPLCSAITQLLPPKDGNVLEVAKYVQSLKCGQQGHSMLVCCADGMQKNRSVVESFLPPGECGAFLQFHIFRGEATSIYDYPWVARIRYYKGSNRYGFHCSGVLIHSQHVLTTASCIEEVPSNWIVHQVRLGEYDTSTKIDCDGDECADPVRDVMIANVIVHADYFRESIAYYNDIALLELIEPVEFTDFVQPICLPIAPEVRQVNYTGMYMTIAGWGQTLNGGVSTRKQHLYVRLLSNETCVNAFRSLQIDIRPTQVCVDGGGNNLNACRSEAGGPLIRRGDGVSSYQYWYLIGLASFGVEQCRTDGMPVVYTRLTEHIDWLKDVMSGTI